MTRNTTETRNLKTNGAIGFGCRQRFRALTAASFKAGASSSATTLLAEAKHAHAALVGHCGAWTSGPNGRAGLDED